MTHTHIDRDELSAFLDGDSPGDRRQVIEQHLEQCEDCSQVRDELSQARACLRSLSPAPASAAYVDQVLEQAWPQAAQPTPPRSLAWPSHLLSAAVGAAAAALLMWVSMPGADSMRPLNPEAVATSVPMSDAGNGTQAEPERRIAQVDRTVYLFETREVPVPYEVRVEVPVEHIVERPVERVVEVPTPLPEEMTLAFQALSGLSGVWQHAWGRSEDRVAPTERPVASSPSLLARGGPVPRPEDLEVPASSARAARVVVRGQGDDLRLWTRGSDASVVPGLIALLRDKNPVVVDLAHDRLVQVHERLSAHPEWTAQALPRGDESDLQVRWEVWWSEHASWLEATTSL